MRAVKSGSILTYSGYQVSSSTVGPFTGICLIPFDLREDTIIKNIGTYITAHTLGVGFTWNIELGIYSFNRGEIDENAELLGSNLFDIGSSIPPYLVSIPLLLHLKAGNYLLAIGKQSTVTDYTTRALNIFKVNFVPFFKLSAATATVEISYYTAGTGTPESYLPSTLEQGLFVMTAQTGTSIPYIFIETN